MASTGYTKATGRHTSLSLRRLAVVVFSVVAFATLAAGCGLWSTGGTGVIAEDEIVLTEAQPVVAVEFEASFESLTHESGIFADLMVNSPREPDDFDGVLLDGWFRRELWNGQTWEPSSEDPEVYRLGTNVFRYRWVFELAPDATSATVPIAGEMLLHYGDGSELVPGELDYRDLQLEITAIYAGLDG